MAKMDLCDVCLSEGRYRESHWRAGFKRPHMKVDLCDEHRLWGKGLSAEEFDRAAIALVSSRRQGT